MVSGYPPPFEDCSALQTMTGSAGRVASDTEWVTEALDVTIYKGLEIQVEGIQLATDYKSLGTATKPTLSFSPVPNSWLPSESIFTWFLKSCVHSAVGS